jgi:hypothetical protein
MKRITVFLAVSMMLAVVAAGQTSHKDITVLKMGVTSGVNHFTNRAEFTQWGCTVPETMDVRGLNVTIARRPNSYWLSEEGDWGFEWGATGTIGTSEFQNKKDIFLSLKPYLALIMVPCAKVKYGCTLGVPITMAASKAVINGKSLGATPASVAGGCFAQYGKLSLGVEYNFHEDSKFYLSIEF